MPDRATQTGVPAVNQLGAETSEVGLPRPGSRYAAANVPPTNVARKTIRQTTVPPGGRSWQKMPEMPATRPLPSHRMAADRPISRPPIVAGMGVNVSMRHILSISQVYHSEFPPTSGAQRLLL